MLGVTGADGFVGSALCEEAVRRGVAVVPITRRGGKGARPMGDLESPQFGPELFAGIETLVHCAAMVHVMDADDATDLAAFRRVNRDGTLALAHAALAAGVRRFIFISTVKVLGERSHGRPFAHDDPLAPGDPYSTSKAEAELALRDLVLGTSMEVVIVRPPLVHGPGAGGNLAVLLKLLRLRIPLPLAAIRNSRAVLGIENFVDALLRAAVAPGAAGQVLMLRDEPTLSTAEIVRALGEGAGIQPLLWSLPEQWIRRVAGVLGREAYAARVLDSLDVSLEHTTAVTGWVPRLSAQDGLRRVARSRGE
ncbi:MAG: NAD-dependent epimerase/dehydratase family protein [Gemmatimonadales bacterium]